MSRARSSASGRPRPGRQCSSSGQQCRPTCGTDAAGSPCAGAQPGQIPGRRAAHGHVRAHERKCTNRPGCVKSPAAAGAARLEIARSRTGVAATDWCRVRVAAGVSARGNGGGGRTRTSDTGLMRPLLCHLSYAAASGGRAGNLQAYDEPVKREQGKEKAIVPEIVPVRRRATSWRSPVAPAAGGAGSRISWARQQGPVNSARPLHHTAAARRSSSPLSRDRRQSEPSGGDRLAGGPPPSR
jgi:hypothetical protein